MIDSMPRLRLGWRVLIPVAVPRETSQREADLSVIFFPRRDLNERLAA
jgi:hypothetical protein